MHKMLLFTSALLSTMVTAQSLTVDVGAQLPNKQVAQAKFVPDANYTQGKHRYFVFFTEQPAALYDGGITGYAATKKSAGQSRFNAKSSAVSKYQNLLEQKQQSFISVAEKQIKRPLNTEFSYQLALNAVVMSLTQEEASALSKLDQVKRVQREEPHKLMTDSGPAWIGADKVWQGDGVDTPHSGEGVVVAIFDTGVNTDNPSFAATGADGYTHTNPKSQFFGDCVADAALCNNKLIGVYSHASITDTYNNVRPANGEDYNGHGSHTASTAAGNVLRKPGNDIFFNEISGVAPHANIVSFQVCDQKDDGTGSCFPALTAFFVEEAIKIGVDVINYSVGGSASNPWLAPDALAFLSAREAGIHVAVSAGNEGVNEQGEPVAASISSPADAPWVSSVAAYSHDRVNSNQLSFSGGANQLAPIQGFSLTTTAVTAPIVWAGDFVNPNDTQNDPGQCLQPFPTGTFNGQIVICDRGEIARVAKGSNVAAGGAGGYVLANVATEENLVADNHVLPGTHISFADGQILKQWLQTGSGHSATLSAAQLGNVARFGNYKAGFSSMGPNPSVPGILAPHVAAPGISVYAAYADDKPEELTNLNPSDAADFAFLSGTSMASPHVAGALALIDALKPEWSPAEAQSALMLTANSSTRACLGCEESSSTPFQQGSGAINVQHALNTGLVMDISGEQYRAANPIDGGVANELNMAAWVSASCVGKCTLLRTVKATQSATWELQTATKDGLSASVSPSSFTLAEGEIQQIALTIDVTQLTQEWGFGELQLTTAGQQLSMPIAARSTNDNIPQAITLTTGRNTDSSKLRDLVSDALNNIQVSAVGFGAANQLSGNVIQDPTPDDSISIRDGVNTHKIEAPNGAAYITINVGGVDTSSADLDLWLFRDSNGDNTLDAFVAASLNAGSNEAINVANLPAGDYYLLVQNYQASNAAADSYNIEYALIEDVAADNIQATISQGEFGRDIDLSWNDPFTESQRLLGAIKLEDSLTAAVKVIKTELIRTQTDELQASFSPQQGEHLAPGETATFSLTIAANQMLATRQFEVTVPITQGLSLVPSSITENGQLSNNQLKWQFEHLKGAQAIELNFAINTAKAGDYQIAFQTSVDSAAEDTVHSVDFSVDNLAPVAVISGATQAAENTQVTLSGQDSSDQNNDSLTYQWSQTSGPNVSFDSSAEQISFSTPQVTANTDLVFQLVVKDGLLDSAAVTHTVTVTTANATPVAQISGATSVNEGASVSLSGTDSSDDDGDTLTYQWTQTSGPSVSFDATASSISFTAPQVTTNTVLTFQLVVNDGQQNSTAATHNLTVNNLSSPTPPTPPSSGGGGSTGYVLMFTLLGLLFRKYKLRQ